MPKINIILFLEPVIALTYQDSHSWIIFCCFRNAWTCNQIKRYGFVLSAFLLLLPETYGVRKPRHVESESVMRSVLNPFYPALLHDPGLTPNPPHTGKPADMREGFRSLG